MTNVAAAHVYLLSSAVGACPVVRVERARVLAGIPQMTVAKPDTRMAKAEKSEQSAAGLDELLLHLYLECMML